MESNEYTAVIKDITFVTSVNGVICPKLHLDSSYWRQGYETDYIYLEHEVITVRDALLKIGDTIAFTVHPNGVVNTIRMLTTNDYMVHTLPITETCPCCGCRPILRDTILRCINTSCSVQLNSNIERFMRSTDIEFTGKELMVLSLMAARQRVLDLTDIFTLTDTEISAVFNGETQYSETNQNIPLHVKLIRHRDILMHEGTIYTALGVPGITIEKSKELCRIFCFTPPDIHIRPTYVHNPTESISHCTPYQTTINSVLTVQDIDMVRMFASIESNNKILMFFNQNVSK